MINFTKIQHGFMLYKYKMFVSLIDLPSDYYYWCRYNNMIVISVFSLLYTNLRNNIE